MSITLLNVHKHKIWLSYCREVNRNLNLKYFVSGWYDIEKGKSYKLKENDYINLHCSECNYIYCSDKNIKIYTTNNVHDFYFTNFGSDNIYTQFGQKILLDNNYYLGEYYRTKNEYNRNLYIGNEKEIIDYVFSEMIKSKSLYDEEKSKNKSLNNDKAQKIKEINNLNSRIEKLSQKVEETHMEKLKLQEENIKLKEKIMKFGIKYNTENGEGDYDIILCVDSIKNLTNNGWIIKYNKQNGKEFI